MTSTRTHSWQAIQDRIRQNILDRTWAPGELIPGEVALAAEFGCARTTVNRALRELATTGVIERKRKAGTRVAKQRARRVTAEIPVIRAQVQQRDQAYRFRVVGHDRMVPPEAIRKAMHLRARQKALHIRYVHLADGSPFIVEDRWVNTKTVPDILNVDLNEISANEWLVANVPFTNGQFLIDAQACSKRMAAWLKITPDSPILRSTRATWLDEQSVTLVNLYYTPGHQIEFAI